MAQTLMPIVQNPPTKPDGKPYTEDDREYWELYNTHLPNNMRGIREHRHFSYPRMLFKAKDGRAQHESYDRLTVESEREQAERQRKDPAWCESKEAASAYFEQQHRDIARAAAEVAAAAQTMSAPAKRQYTKRSAESKTHVTE